MSTSSFLPCEFVPLSMDGHAPTIGSRAPVMNPDHGTGDKTTSACSYSQIKLGVLLSRDRSSRVLSTWWV